MTYEVVAVTDLSPGDDVALFSYFGQDRRELEEDVGNVEFLESLEWTPWPGPGSKLIPGTNFPVAPFCFRRVP